MVRAYGDFPATTQDESTIHVCEGDSGGPVYVPATYRGSDGARKFGALPTGIVSQAQTALPNGDFDFSVDFVEELAATDVRTSSKKGCGRKSSYVIVGHALNELQVNLNGLNF